jgi:hypothetical protein
MFLLFPTPIYRVDGVVISVLVSSAVDRVQSGPNHHLIENNFY